VYVTISFVACSTVQVWQTVGGAEVSMVLKCLSDRPAPVKVAIEYVFLQP
jgi:hypothetical protein